VLVETPVLHGDDRLREILAELVLTDRTTVLFRLELAYPVAVRTVDRRVLDEVRVPAIELVVVGLHQKQV
jgi:hypothetical protein